LESKLRIEKCFPCRRRPLCQKRRVRPRGGIQGTEKGAVLLAGIAGRQAQPRQFGGQGEHFGFQLRDGNIPNSAMQ